MAIVTKSNRSGHDTVVVKTKQDSSKAKQGHAWWKAKSKEELNNQVIETAAFLKETQQYRMRQVSVYSRMYGNMPLMNFAGTGISKMNMNGLLPIDRPTMNIVQSIIDTKVARIGQSRPRPVFLTDAGDYKERNLAKQLNQFILGEFYRAKAYEIGLTVLRDAEVFGTGVVKVFEKDCLVQYERVLASELYVDNNDGMYGQPRQMYQLKLIDREVLAEMFPEKSSKIDKAQQAYPDSSDESTKTVSDQVMVVEAWKLPSGKDSGDGMHVICCDAGILFDEEYKKEKFPFVFIHSSPRLLGFWGQGAAERLMGTQMEINKLLITISQSINLMGVPRVFIEEGSKVVKAHLNNQVGSIVTYRGIKPEYVVAPSVHPEIYQQLQRLIEYGFQQEGVSQLNANSQKPAGLNAAAALREFEDIQADRFATLVKQYDQMFIDLAYLNIDMAKDIAEREGKYSTIYPNKNGTREIDLPKASILEDTYVIQCHDSSSLPKNPAGRMEKITEMMQAGLISPSEGRRLLDFADLDQEEKLANAAEERILKILDDMVEDGKFTPPDPYMNLQLAMEKVVQYINLYAAAKLEESKMQLLRDFFTQLQTLMQAAMPQQPPTGAPGQPLGATAAPPVVNPMIPQQ